jgi:hypothetical protein
VADGLAAAAAGGVIVEELTDGHLERSGELEEHVQARGDLGVLGTHDAVSADAGRLGEVVDGPGARGTASGDAVADLAAPGKDPVGPGICGHTAKLGRWRSTCQ